jgi:hypothetical protein
MWRIPGPALRPSPLVLNPTQKNVIFKRKRRVHLHDVMWLHSIVYGSLTPSKGVKWGHVVTGREVVLDISIK